MIHARKLSRTYQARTGPVEAVRGVDLDVEAGEVVGFLGPNGAGKTTTLKMLTTLIKPTAGEATVAGHDLLRDPVGVRRNIGYVAQGGVTLDSARAGEECVDQARLYGMSWAEASARGKDLFGQLDLDAALWDRNCNSLSGGQRRRLDIVIGLMHTPALVFLDEPTTGLDPQSRANLWDHILRLRDDLGSTVFLTTHYLDEADYLCDRLLVIDNGVLVAAGTPEELKAKVSGDAVRLTLSDPARAQDAVKVLAGLDRADTPTVDGDRVQVHVPVGGAALPGLLRELDVFLSLTGRSLRDV
jgi:ABC-2 type transport system ATP-binding protein